MTGALSLINYNLWPYSHDSLAVLMVHCVFHSKLPLVRAVRRYNALLVSAPECNVLRVDKWLCVLNVEVL